MSRVEHLWLVQFDCHTVEMIDKKLWNDKQACSHVSGIVALVLQKHRMTQDEVRGALKAMASKDALSNVCECIPYTNVIPAEDCQAPNTPNLLAFIGLA